MLNIWLGFSLAVIGANWLSVWFGWRSVNLITKPGVMIALLAWFASAGGWQPAAAWFGIGLAFSLVGDILLMLPNRFFLYGAAAFMATHAAFIAGFSQPLPEFNLLTLSSMMIFLSLMAIMYAALRRGVKSSAAFHRMTAPLALYSAALSLMVFMALTTLFRQAWRADAAGLAASGALLFLFSDILLAVDRFVRQLPPARLWKRVAYHLGQLALAAGALINFSK